MRPLVDTNAGEETIINVQTCHLDSTNFREIHLQTFCKHNEDASPPEDARKRLNEDALPIINQIVESFTTLNEESLQLSQIRRLTAELAPIFTQTQSLRRSARVRGVSLLK